MKNPLLGPALQHYKKLKYIFAHELNIVGFFWQQFLQGRIIIHPGYSAIKQTI